MFGLKIRGWKKSQKKVSMSKKVKKKRKKRGSGTHLENAIDNVDAKTNSSSSSSESGVEGNGLELPESELYQPMSSEAAAEEAETTEIILEHEAFIADNPPSSSGTRKNAHDNDSGGPVKSFFSKFKGIDSVAIAVSARSKCYFCDNRIDKGTVRFCFYHNELRPSVWVHPSCIPHLLKREGLLADGVVKLEGLQSEGQAESLVLKTVREVLTKVRTKLEST